MGGKQPNCPKVAPQNGGKPSQNRPEIGGKQPNFPKIAPQNRGKSAKIASQIAPKMNGVKHGSKTPENLNFAVFWVLVPFIGPKHTKRPPHWQKIIPQNRSIFVAFGGIGGAKNQTHTTLPQNYPKIIPNTSVGDLEGLFAGGVWGNFGMNLGFFLCLWWVMGRLGKSRQWEDKSARPFPQNQSLSCYYHRTITIAEFQVGLSQSYRL